MFLFSCNDEEQFTTDSNALITFSKDTIAFDTVFTTIGSSTKSFQVYNNNDKGVRLSNIRLASGGESGFRVNVDGQYGTSFSNINILKKDSIFVFVEVTVNPQDEDSPVLITDSLMFTQENGKCKRVVLQAYGQDIIILKDVAITEDTSFEELRPYVIYDSLVVKENATLTIDPGVTLCFHSEATLNVHGTVKAVGTNDEPITFRGDRTDKMFWYLPYDRLDGQWGGISLFEESTGNTFNHVDIHGGTWGIDCYYSGTEKTKLTLLNSTVHNVKGSGITSVCNKILVANSQITNAKENCLTLLGGYYDFYYTTIAQFYPWSAEYGKALTFTNVYDEYAYPLDALNFSNCIITGYEEDVVEGRRYEGKDDEGDNIAFNLTFNNCLVRTDTVGSSQYFIDCIIENKDSEVIGEKNFKTIDTDNYIYDFQLDPLSPARKIGTYIKQYKKDKNGVTRKTDHPDAGCYELIE